MPTNHHQSQSSAGRRAHTYHKHNVVSIARARRRRWARRLPLAILAFVSGSPLDELPNAHVRPRLEHRRSVNMKRHA
jgi:hypothetical protein